MTSAEYMTFYDVFGDLKLIFGDQLNEAWGKSFDEIKSASEASLRGFSCHAENEKTLICEKNHWTGEYQVTMHFNEGKLAASTCLLTGFTIQNLNYKPTSKNVYYVNDLILRMKKSGFIPENAPEQQVDNLFLSAEITPYTPAYILGENTRFQAGFKAKSEINPKFYLAFIIRDISTDLGFSYKPGYTQEQSDYVSNLQNDKSLPTMELKPEEIPAESEADFYGEWKLLYIYSTMFIVNEDPVIFRYDILVENPEIEDWFIINEASTIMKNGNKETSVKSEFVDGKLLLDEKYYLEMNDNGMLSYEADDIIQYYVKNENDEWHYHRSEFETMLDNKEE